MRRRALAASALLVALAWGAPARAAGSLETIAPAVAKQLGAVPAGALVVAAPLASDQPAPKGEELAARVAALVAGAIGGTARAHPTPAPLAIARALAGQAGALVFVQAEIAKGQLRATADVYPVMSNGWDRIRVPQPPPRAHAFAAAPIDAEVRTFLPSIALERAEVHRAKQDEGDVLAAACGDVDGDGGMELVLVSRARVALGKIAAGRFVASRTAAWSALAPRAPVPLRDPLAGVMIDARGIAAATTDRGGVLLDASLARVATIRGVPVALGVADGCATVDPELSSFVGAIVGCAPGTDDRAGAVAPPAARYDALAGASIGTAAATRAIVAAREPSGKLQLRMGDASATVDGVGVPLAIGDLDQDGVPEVITTANDGEDAITIASWDGGDRRVRLALPAAPGVRALAVCPPEERGAPALVAVVGDEVWVVR